MSDASVEGNSVSCRSASESLPEPTGAGVSGTSSRSACAGPGYTWDMGAFSNLIALGVGSTEADSWIGVVDGAGKDVRRDGSAQDPSGQAELGPWTDGIELEAQFVMMSAAAIAECTGGLSESAAFADAEATRAALEFWIRVEFDVRADSYKENGSEHTCSESSGLRLR